MKQTLFSSPELLQQYVLLMRYHSKAPKYGDLAYCSYEQLGKQVKCSPTKVRSICMKYFASQNQSVSKKSKRISKRSLKRKQCYGVLTREHIEYLTDQETLKKQVGMSLAQRAAIFNSKYIEVGISGGKLGHIYRANGVKRKTIKITKLLTQRQRRRQLLSLREIAQQLQVVEQQNGIIVYLDEVMFTVNTVNKKEFSNRFDNITMDMKRMHIKTTAVIAAITYEHGVLTWKKYDRSVNIPKFKQFLLILRKMLRNRRVFIFLDNLSCHRSRSTLEYMENLGLVPIFNAAYSPSYMPIETVFSQVKHFYKRQNTNAVVNWQTLKTNEWIDQAFKSVEIQKVQNMINHCIKILQDDINLANKVV